MEIDGLLSLMSGKVGKNILHVFGQCDCFDCEYYTSQSFLADAISDPFLSPEPTPGIF